MSLAPRLQRSALVGEMSRPTKPPKEQPIELGWPGLASSAPAGAPHI